MVRAYCLSIARAAPTDDVSPPTDLGAALLGLLEWCGSTSSAPPPPPSRRAARCLHAQQRTLHAPPHEQQRTLHAQLRTLHAPAAQARRDCAWQVRLLTLTLTLTLTRYRAFDFSRVQICWDKEQPFAPRPPLAAARCY